jgi:hypothetical protein
MRGDGPALDTDQMTLHTLLPLGDETSARRPALPAEVRRAVWALLACRTARLGGHVQACPDGPIARSWEHSCRHRRCPPWAWLPIARWVATQTARWVACDHDQVLVTLPHALHARWGATVAVMTPRWCTRVQATWFARRRDAPDLGAQPGMIATVHPWSPTRLLPPHLHTWVTGGGRTAPGPWRAVRNGVLRPMAVVRAVFRGHRRAAIPPGLAPGTLPLAPGQSRQPRAQRLNTWGRPQWHVPLRERYAHGTGGLT